MGRVEEAMLRPLAGLAVAGVIYSLGLAAAPSPNPWWSAIAWGGAAGAVLCAACGVLSRGRAGFEWAVFLGLLAGGWTHFPALGDPSPAAVFRVFLVFALRRALALGAGNDWAVGCLLTAAAVRVAPGASNALVTAAVVVTAADLATTRWRAPWSRPFAACLALPVALVALWAVGAPAVEFVFVGAVLTLVLYAAMASTKAVLDPPGAIP